MSNADAETPIAETSQQRYNTRKRKLSEDVGAQNDAEIVDREELVAPVDKLEMKKTKIKAAVQEDDDDDDIELIEEELLKSENGVEPEVERTETNGTTAAAASAPENRVTRSRKRKLSSDEKEKEKEDKVKPETSRKRKQKEEVQEVAVKKKRVAKKECLCVPYERKPDYSQDKDAVITVEDWRLQSVQSPIALKHEDSNEYDHFDPLEFHGHWENEGDASITNNGYTATLTFKNREQPFLLGGPLHEDIFVFEQLHFHWSNDDHSGCEHIFEGKAYSMEAHAVHYNSKYQSFKDAVDKHDGLAVVAFFLQATDDFENECFNKLSEAVKDIVKINSTTEVKPDCLSWIQKSARCKGYYTYQGSLTTEPYFESVTWIIYPKPIHISREQVQNFRNMKSTPCEKHNILNNVRPVQTPVKKLDLIYARSHKISE